MSNSAYEKRGKFKSTLGWIKTLSSRDKNHEMIETAFSFSYPFQDIDPNAKPVNLLIMDGGGMKGYGSIAVMETLQNHFMDEGRDLIDQFDFFSGTSVGGIASLFCSMHNARGESTSYMLMLVRDLIDEVREQIFEKVSFWNFILLRDLQAKQISDILKQDHDLPLKSNAKPAMACIATVKPVRKDDRGEKNANDKEKREFEPFIARTYEYANANSASKNSFCPSSCNMKLYEAMAATSAVPLLVDRVRVKVDGEWRTMADGMMFENCPLTFSLEEVRRLFPGRPIGVILNIGFSDKNADELKRTLEVAKEVHPKMHFHRIAPTHIMEHFSPAETNMNKIARMEAEVKDWILNTPSITNDIKTTMMKLYSSRKGCKTCENFQKKRNLSLNLESQAISELNKRDGFRRRALSRSMAETDISFRRSMNAFKIDDCDDFKIDDCDNDSDDGRAALIALKESGRFSMVRNKFRNSLFRSM